MMFELDGKAPSRMRPGCTGQASVQRPYYHTRRDLTYDHCTADAGPGFVRPLIFSYRRSNTTVDICCS